MLTLLAFTVLTAIGVFSTRTIGVFAVLLGVTLVFTSAAIYVLHYMLFDDAHHIFIYMLGDVAFVPIEVFLVLVLRRFPGDYLGHKSTVILPVGFSTSPR